MGSIALNKLKLHSSLVREEHIYFVYMKLCFHSKRYCIFYCPFDLAHAVTSTLAFRILATAMSTISQVQLIDRGVHLAAQVYGNAPIPMLVVGTVMGSGAEVLKPVASLLINRCQHNQMAYLKLSKSVTLN